MVIKLERSTAVPPKASQNGTFVASVHEGALADTLRINVKWLQFGPAWQSCELRRGRVFNLNGRKELAEK